MKNPFIFITLIQINVVHAERIIPTAVLFYPT